MTTFIDRDNYLLDRIITHDGKFSRRLMNTSLRYSCACCLVWEHSLISNEFVSKDYDSTGTVKLIEAFLDYRMNYPDQCIPEGYGPCNYTDAFDLNSFQILRHRNPFDGSAVLIFRFALSIVKFV